MHRHLSCQEVVELTTDYLEQALPTGEASLFEQHLNFCDGCERYLDQMRKTIATVGRPRESDVPAHARAQLLAVFRDWKGG
jgi:putative zinc finger protein